MPVRATLAALALALGAPAPASAAGACAAYGPGDAHLFCANVVDYAVALAPGEELFKKMQPFVIIGFCWSLFSVLTLYSEFEKVVNRSAWESSFDDWGDCLLAHWALPRSGQKDACGVVPKHLEPGAASTLARRGADADRRFGGRPPRFGTLELGRGRFGRRSDDSRALVERSTRGRRRRSAPVDDAHVEDVASTQGQQLFSMRWTANFVVMPLFIVAARARITSPTRIQRERIRMVRREHFRRASRPR